MQFGLVKLPVVVISKEDDGAIRPWQGATDLLRNIVPVPQEAGVEGLHLQPPAGQYIISGTLEEDQAV